MTKQTIFNAGLALTAVFLLSASDGGCGDTHILENTGFDLWCGESLCFWSVDKGSVAKAPTWHSNDYAVALVGDVVAISQLSDVSHLDVGCIEFSLLANVEPNATVHIEMDVFDDGIVDWRQPIPASNWAAFKYLVKLPSRYQGIRFRLTKTGSGEAAVAQIVANSSGACDMPPIGVTQQPNGASCALAEQCDSSICGQEQFPAGSRTCGSCASSTDCAPTEICGSESPEQTFLDLYQGCGAPARHQLGERCVAGDECSTGICCGEVCSTCCTGTECDAGEACGRRQVQGDMEWWFSPRQCNAGAGGTNSGQECLIDADCDSGQCNGVGDMRVCLFDGRVCSTNTDCPADLDCVSIGTAGGACE